MSELTDILVRLQGLRLKERDALRSAADDLLRICDGSNWPEEAQSGLGYQVYTEVTEQLHEIADNLLAALATAEKSALQRAIDAGHSDDM